MVHRRLLALAGQLRGPLAVGILVGWLVMAARVTQAALFGVVLGRIFHGDGFASVTGLLVLIAVVVVVRGVLVWLREVVAQAAAASVKDRIRDRLYGRLVELGPGHLASARTGAAQATVVDGVEALEACLTGPIAVVVWMFSADVWVGTTVLVAVLVVPLVPRLWDRMLSVRGREHWESYTELGAEYLDSMQGMTTLKSLNAALTRRRLLTAKAVHLFRTTMRQMAVSMIDTGLRRSGCSSAWRSPSAWAPCGSRVASSA